MTQAAIILAAGRSTRMGRCKASLPWLHGQTLLGYQVTQWQQAGCQAIVVLGSHNAHQHDYLQGVLRVINPDPEAGKTQSIRLGLAALPADCTLLAISAVDQPRPTVIYQQLIAAHQQHPLPITVPVYDDKTGHPILFSARLLPVLNQIREETQGLRQIMAARPSQISRLNVPSSQVHADLNTPEAYQSLLYALAPNPASDHKP